MQFVAYKPSKKGTLKEFNSKKIIGKDARDTTKQINQNKIILHQPLLSLINHNITFIPS